MRNVMYNWRFIQLPNGAEWRAELNDLKRPSTVLKRSIVVWYESKLEKGRGWVVRLISTDSKGNRRELDIPVTGHRINSPERLKRNVAKALRGWS